VNEPTGDPKDDESGTTSEKVERMHLVVLRHALQKVERNQLDEHLSYRVIQEALRDATARYLATEEGRALIERRVRDRAEFMVDRLIEQWNTWSGTPEPARALLADVMVAHLRERLDATKGERR
jgi:hypothetical protein